MGLLCAVLSVPLILKKVPMNRSMGIRISKACVSQSNWYAINAFGGKLFLVFGLLLVLFSFLSRDVAPPPNSIWAPVFLIAPLAIAGVLIALLIDAFAHRLPGE
jgi:hypothetical protein